MSDVKEQYCQTGTSLCSVYDNCEDCFFPIDSDDNEPDYDDAAADIESLHYHLQEVENKQTPYSKPELKAIDAWPQV